MLLQTWNACTADELMHRWYGVSRSEIAAHAGLVEQAAREGDATAMHICESAAKHLAGYAEAVRGVLFSTEGTVPVGYVGGVFQSEIIRDAFARETARLRCIAQPPVMSPAYGALLEAMRLDGNTNDLTITQHEIK
jgi:N-acetylglucosamine kinase-like BadF-type ATPase